MKKIITAPKPKMPTILSSEFLEDMQYSDEYAEYIMEQSKGDRIICNGDTLLDAMEDGYMFESFLTSLE